MEKEKLSQGLVYLFSFVIFLKSLFRFLHVRLLEVVVLEGGRVFQILLCKMCAFRNFFN